MSDLKIIELDRKHVERFYGVVVPDDVEIVGYAGFYGRLLAMFGGLFLRGDHWWFCFSHRPGVTRPPIIHRYALQTLKAASRAGITKVYAVCDRDIPTAAKWLTRMGFKETQPLEEFNDILQGERLYIWQTP